MKKQIVFATGNPHKIQEVKQLLGDRFDLLSLKDIGCEEEVPETQATIEGNALQKARYVYEHFGHFCFSEDTGLEIDALDGAPGVHSARYAGDQRDPEANIDLVLKQLQGVENRKARFKTVVALIIDGRTLTFEGIVEGRIRSERAGSGGFGYDPVFQPDGYEQTFGELDASVKNQISHRARAIDKLLSYLDQHSAF